MVLGGASSVMANQRAPTVPPLLCGSELAWRRSCWVARLVNGSIAERYDELTHDNFHTALSCGAMEIVTLNVCPNPRA